MLTGVQGHHFNGQALGIPMLMSHWNNELTSQSETIPNCPLHPITNDLPSPLPQKIKDALQQVENQLSAILNSTNLVSMKYSLVYIEY